MGYNKLVDASSWLEVEIRVYDAQTLREERTTLNEHLFPCFCHLFLLLYESLNSSIVSTTFREATILHCDYIFRMDTELMNTESCISLQTPKGHKIPWKPPPLPILNALLTTYSVLYIFNVMPRKSRNVGSS